tara:strand:- start:746 stop:880 length:135 start_codon:yes stop_codon:yes gene_type:complete
LKFIKIFGKFKIFVERFKIFVERFKIFGEIEIFGEIWKIAILGF